MPIGAHRSFTVPTGPVAQNPESHEALNEQGAPSGRREVDDATQAPAVTTYPTVQAVAVQLP
jgi:hypothetical protein